MIESNFRRSTVLLVDPDEQLRLLATAALAPIARVVEVPSAEQAFARLDNELPDLIITDTCTPGMSGLEFCRRLRAADSTRHLPVLMMTGDGDERTLERAYEAGATDFVDKSVAVETLHHRVRYLLRSGAAFRELCDSRISLAKAERIARLGHWTYLAEQREFTWSDEMFRIFNLERTATVDLETWVAQVHPDDAESVRLALQQAIEGGVSHRVEYRTRQRNGSERHVFQQAENTTDRCTDKHLLGTVQDVTERKVAEAEMRLMAYRDTLTGLPNRRLFADRLERSVEDARRTHRRVAVLHLDIDRFKTINEGFGHDFGDQLLQSVAQRLASCLRIDDTLARGADAEDPTLSRLAGDEFMVVLSALGDGSEPQDIAGRLLEALARPFIIDGAELLATGSVGVAVFPDDSARPQTLIQHAGTALRHAKAEGGNCHLFYSDRMNTDAATRLELAGHLHRALADQEFELTYQPICDTASGLVGSVEALVRWNDPTHGLVPASRFIPVAEETGLVLPLGELAIDLACRQWCDWLEAGVGRVTIALNVSAKQFHHAGFVDRVRAIVEKYDVDPLFLRFEITEGVLMRATPGTVANTHALRAMGIGLSVDDFGTGYYSLSYLRRFPAEVLKIDSSFLDGIPENQDNCSLVSAIVAMAHKLRLQVVAEGIETEAQLRFVRALDCESVQGPLLGAAMLADEIEPLLRSKLKYACGSSVVPFRSRAVS